ncbi:hypothetical protein [Nocardioides insulae]|uniref:hypothetical protein n=1 Tax=Nocardioides insulae TaxID=394734 RepID=UPI0004199623|nr:hypothetical protein [Nocardioides insulae]
MRMFADLAAPAPDELVDPVGYSSWWALFGVLAVLAVVVYYVVVSLWGRPWRRRTEQRRGGDVGTVRAQHLEQLDAVESAVAAGSLAARVAHQQLSTILRSYVAQVTPIEAPVMTLEELRADAPAELAEAIEVMYPPEFAPDDLGGADRAFGEAAHRARSLVTRWG